MSVFKTRLAQALLFTGMKQVDLAKKAKISESQISHYMHGDYEPNAKKCAAIAEALGVTPAWLLGQEELPISAFTLRGLKPGRTQQTIPILGKVAAGEPIFADENLIGTLTIEDPRSDLFALHITGDSMSPRIMDGDLVLVHKQNTANDGDLVIALHEDAATCKVYRKNSWGVSLVPFNTSYAPFVFSGSDAAEQLQIIGKVIGSYHSWE